MGKDGEGLNSCSARLPPSTEAICCVTDFRGRREDGVRMSGIAYLPRYSPGSKEPFQLGKWWLV